MKYVQMLGRVVLLLGTNLTGYTCLAASQTEILKSLAQTYTEASLEYAQPYAYYNDLELTRHDRFLENTQMSRSIMENTEDLLLTTLKAIDYQKLESNKAKIFYVKFLEVLQTNVELRSCKSELWSISHMFGPHSLLDFLINVQPVKSEQDKKDALARWTAASAYYGQEITNLNLGLNLGYSAPKRVVVRLVEQLNRLTQIDIDDHPYLKLAARANDEVFAKNFRNLVEHKLIPSIKHYADYLGSTYMSRARTELGIKELPNGEACYMAAYRSYTTLKRTPKEVFDLGLKTVTKNKEEVLAIAKSIYKVNSFSEAIAKASGEPSEKFADSQQMHQYFEKVVKRSKKMIASYFAKMPAIKMKVEPIPEYQQGTGRSAHYVPGTKERAAKFAYDPTNFNIENYASAEKVSVHEGYPGHHLQIALVQEQEKFHPIEASFSNSAFSEGWARYAEALSEEAGIYQRNSTRVLRRAWPARGMVADTALHMLGWSNEKVAAFLVESGASFAKNPNDMLDRMAAMPAQLTAYDSGALEIFALRELMEKQLGDRFDIKEFHQLILSNGNVPLSVLRKQVVDFLKQK